MTISSFYRSLITHNQSTNWKTTADESQNNSFIVRVFCWGFLSHLQHSHYHSQQFSQDPKKIQCDTAQSYRSRSKQITAYKALKRGQIEPKISPNFIYHDHGFFEPMKLESNKFLVGGFNPFEKYDRQIGSFPQIEVNIPKIFELPPPRFKNLPKFTLQVMVWLGDVWGEQVLWDFLGPKNPFLPDSFSGIPNRNPNHPNKKTQPQTNN